MMLAYSSQKSISQTSKLFLPSKTFGQSYITFLSAIATSHAITAQLALKAVTLISQSLELFLVPFGYGAYFIYVLAFMSPPQATARGI